MNSCVTKEIFEPYGPVTGQVPPCQAKRQRTGQEFHNRSNGINRTISWKSIPVTDNRQGGARFVQSDSSLSGPAAFERHGRLTETVPDPDRPAGDLKSSLGKHAFRDHAAPALTARCVVRSEAADLDNRR